MTAGHDRAIPRGAPDESDPTPAPAARPPPPSATTPLEALAAGLDGALYVADPQTYELVFANRPTPAQTSEAKPVRCYEAMHGRTAPCPWCDIGELLLDPTKPFVRDRRDAVAGRTLRTSSRLVPWSDGRRLRVELAADVTHARAAEEALTRNERRYRTLVEALQEGIWVIDDTALTTWVNPRMEELLGYERGAMLGRHVHSFTDAVGAEALGRVLERVRSGQREQAELQWVRSDGSRVDVFMSFAPLHSDDGRFEGTVASAMDVTEKKRMQSIVAQNERLANIGMLAAGVAHEVNNPLTYAIYNLESMQSVVSQIEDVLRSCSRALARGAADKAAELLDGVEQLELLAELRHHGARALDGSLRVRSIVRDLKMFSRADSHEVGAVDVNHALSCAVNLARNEIRYRAELVESYGELPPVIASDGRLSQVFLNLLINAVQAMDDAGTQGGRITVRTWAMDGWVYAEVADNGPGMPEDVVAQAFEPFFTTKRLGEGSGLGLTICATIAQSFGGTLSLRSAAGAGATFVLALPAGVPLADSSPPLVQKTVPPPSRRGRVLVVDDEPLIAEMMEHLLAREHQVTIATSGADALRRLAEHPVDVIVCDLMMPEMTGMELHGKVASSWPELADRMVFVTGGAFTPAAREFLARVPNPRIDKPIEARVVRRIVQEVLDAAFDPEGLALLGEPRLAGEP